MSHTKPRSERHLHPENKNGNGATNRQMTIKEPAFWRDDTGRWDFNLQNQGCDQAAEWYQNGSVSFLSLSEPAYWRDDVGRWSFIFQNEPSGVRIYTL